MSYKNYLDDFGKDVEKKVETFKKELVNSKEFANAFLTLTNENCDEKRTTLFDIMMEKIEDVCENNLKEI